MCVDIGVCGHWFVDMGVLTLVCEQWCVCVDVVVCVGIGVYGHWCVLTLVCMDIGVC